MKSWEFLLILDASADKEHHHTSFRQIMALALSRDDFVFVDRSVPPLKPDSWFDRAGCLKDSRAAS